MKNRKSLQKRVLSLACKDHVPYWLKDNKIYKAQHFPVKAVKLSTGGIFPESRLNIKKSLMESEGVDESKNVRVGMVLRQKSQLVEPGKYMVRDGRILQVGPEGTVIKIIKESKL